MALLFHISYTYKKIGEDNTSLIFGANKYPNLSYLLSIYVNWKFKFSPNSKSTFAGMYRLISILLFFITTLCPYGQKKKEVPSDVPLSAPRRE